MDFTKTNIAIALLAASLIILILYGIDVIIIFSSTPNQTSETSRGFLPLDETMRGTVLGGGAVVMSVIAFAIARKERSKIVSLLLLVNGGVVIAGIVAVSAEVGMTSFLLTITLGVILAGLGVWKVVKDRRTPTTKGYSSRVR